LQVVSVQKKVWEDMVLVVEDMIACVLAPNGK
jgi:hypothetical protein